MASFSYIFIQILILLKPMRLNLTGGRIHAAIEPLSQTQDSRASSLPDVPDTESVLRKQDQPYRHGKGPHPEPHPQHGQEHLSGYVANTHMHPSTGVTEEVDSTLNTNEEFQRI